MQLVGMMVGAFLGLLIFGEHSWGFYGSVFIGGLLGVGLRQKAESSAGPKSPLAITSDLGAVPPPIPTVEIENSTKSEGKPVSTEKSRVIPSLILVTVLLTVLGSLAWTTLNNQVAIERGGNSDLVKQRPTISAKIWDSRDCLRTSFPQSQFLAVPPEIDMFCAHPWNQATMSKLRGALNQANIGFVDLLPNHPEIAAMMQSLPDELRDFALIERLLPLAKADEAIVATFKDKLPSSTLEKLRVFKANVPWNDDPTENGLRRYYLGKDITLVTEQFDIRSVAALADAIFIYVTARNIISEAMGGKAADLLDWRGILASGKSFMTLMLLQFNVISESTLIEAPPFETVWANSPHDYEIYFTDALPDWPCSGQSLAGKRAALLCTHDRRLFVSVAPLVAVGDVYPSIGGKPVFKLPPAFFHELAHMFSDPINRQSQPFMAEGRATAQGERTLQIFKAAVSKSSDKWALEDMRRFFSGIGDPSYKGPEVGSVVKIDQAIDDQPFTVFQTAAACHVSDSATDAKYLIRQLEMPAAFFNDQASDEMRAAYYVAWSLFHYGDERERRGQGGSRLDVGIIRKAADLVARNRKIEGQDLTTLDAYLAEVQRRARADIKSKGISCPKNGNL